jgi:hypothetical protein
VLLPAGFEFSERILLALRAHFGKRRTLCGRARACKPIRGVCRRRFKSGKLRRFKSELG